MDRSIGLLYLFSLCACAGTAITWVLGADAGQPPSGPVPVLVGKAVEQTVPAAIELLGTVEPQLATTLSTEIAGLTVRFDLR